MYIGQNLNDHQVAVLQAVADGCLGCRLVSVAKLKTVIENSTRFNCLHDGEMSVADLNNYIDQLVKESLVERQDYKGQPHVGLTQDGARCNRIDFCLFT